jgi:hypothetical protein
MRMIYGVILLGALCACNSAAKSDNAAPAATIAPVPPVSAASSQSTRHARKEDCTKPEVTVTYRPNPLSDAGNCELSTVTPGSIMVCEGAKTMTWNFENYCQDKKVTAKIKDRDRLFPAGDKNDPLFDVTNMAKPIAKSADGKTPGTGTITAKLYDADEYFGTYKYMIGGSYSADPEIDVRRGGPGDTDPGLPGPRKH